MKIEINKEKLKRQLELALDEALIAIRDDKRGFTYALHPMWAKDMPTLADFLIRAIERS